MEEDPKVDCLHHSRDLLLVLGLGTICLSRLVYERIAGCPFLRVLGIDLPRERKDRQAHQILACSLYAGRSCD